MSMQLNGDTPVDFARAALLGLDSRLPIEVALFLDMALSWVEPLTENLLVLWDAKTALELSIRLEMDRTQESNIQKVLLPEDDLQKVQDLLKRVIGGAKP